MQWLFDEFVNWMLDNAAGAIDDISQKVFMLAGMGSEEFVSRIPMYNDLAKGVDELAKALLILVLLFVMLKNMMSFMSGQRQPILKTFFSAIFATFLVYRGRDILAIARNFFGVAYLEFMGIMKPYEVGAISESSQNGGITDWLKAIGRGLAGDPRPLGETVGQAIADGIGKGATEGVLSQANKDESSILLTILLLMLLIEIIKLLVEAIERYVVINIATLFAPLAGPWFVSDETERVTKTFYKMTVVQYLMMIMNVIFLGATPRIVAAISTGDSNDGTMEFAVIFAIAWIKAGQQIDSYLRAMGADVAITGRGLGESLIGAGRTVLGGLGATMPAVGRAAGGFAGGIRSGMGLSGALTGAMAAAVGGSRLGNAVARGASGAANRALQKAGMADRVASDVASKAFREATSSLNGSSAKNLANNLLGEATAKKLGLDKMNADGFAFNGKGVLTARDGNKGVAIAASPDKLKGGNPIVQLKDGNGKTLYAQNLGTAGIESKASAAGVKGSMDSVFGATSGVVTEQIAAAHGGTGMNRYADGMLRGIAEEYGLSLDDVRGSSLQLGNDGTAQLVLNDADGTTIDLAGKLETEGLGNDMVGIQYALTGSNGESLGNIDIGSVAMMGADTDLEGGSLIEGTLDSNTFFSTGHLDDVSSDDEFAALFSDSMPGVLEDTYGANSNVSVMGYDAVNHVVELDNEEVLQIHELATFEGDKNTVVGYDNSGAGYVFTRCVANSETGEYIPKQKIYHRGKV